MDQSRDRSKEGIHSQKNQGSNKGRPRTTQIAIRTQRWQEIDPDQKGSICEDLGVLLKGKKVVNPKPGVDKPQKFVRS